MGNKIKPVELTTRATNDLGKFKEFYYKSYGAEKTEEIIDIIFDRLELLESPNVDLMKMGSIDEEFSHLKREYRKLVELHCKITYRVGKSKIYVVRIFDTRQDPIKNR
ncbi:type II toxin-antitoxin system RelE/ParE family toxin [Aquimarina muelleri]|uniref:Plasmid stabilization system protein ParE n=1 Tax=Aquimarina muelleri TaxID=279356 RepID=A0A918N664_9FLAO|nr:type II toxin-antitoxin system RelE/ParE family toxin [Aquimarina muelleri]MCX2765136.1 type II toxin-antitoxin system RelE/ParE family toxin [Aquimarina muelleri]GGX36707.1 hypothetical protein GCM10007384_39870 [Aquimarina muelleri]